MLTNSQKTQYHRHLILKGVGEEGQLKLNKAKVLVVGAGGLGCPVLQYLAAAGVGTIGVIDPDVVDQTNLQRQVLYTHNNIGKPKVEAAKLRLENLNPYITINAYVKEINKENVLALIGEYDIVVDGSDNFATRYLVADACVILKKPLVFGSIFQFQGQVSVFNYKGGPTYRCLFPEPPAPEDVPNCSDVGVLGVLPGVIGSLQATEAIKIILGEGGVLSGKLLVYDALKASFNTMEFDTSPDNYNRITLEDDYAAFCGVEVVPESISVTELKKWIDEGKEFDLIDVREKEELEICQLPCVHIPINDIPSKITELNTPKIKVVMCHHGMRSASVINYLRQQGVKNLINLEGGIHQWALQVDRSMEVY